MAVSRTTVIVGSAVIAMAAATAAYLLTGENPVIQIRAAENVVKIEAAGVDYAGWPEMGVSVNGEVIGKILVNNAQRAMYSFNVPSTIEEVSSIEVKLLNQSDCRAADFSFVGQCTDRGLTVRSVYLNEQKLEDRVPNGERNTVYSLQSADGGLTFNLAN